MSYRPVLPSRLLIPMAALLAVVIVAISPRSLLAPALSFNRAQESKRPKTPKNVVPTNPSNAQTGVRYGKSPKPGPDPRAVLQTADLPVRPTLASGVPEDAFRQITRPDYLKLFSGSPPGNRLSPPA